MKVGYSYDSASFEIYDTNKDTSTISIPFFFGLVVPLSQIPFSGKYSLWKIPG